VPCTCQREIAPAISGWGPQSRAGVDPDILWHLDGSAGGTTARAEHSTSRLGQPGVQFRLPFKCTCFGAFFTVKSAN
jgi:hypothetical protein